MSVRMLTALGAGGGGAGGGDSEGGKAKEAAEQQRKKPKKKIVLNYEQYQRTANMLVLLLRRANKEEGMKQIELIQAYLADREADGEIQNEEELIQQTGLLRSVIQRLINRDHVLFVVQVRNNFRHKQAGKQTPTFAAYKHNHTSQPLTVAQAADTADRQVLVANANYDPEGQISDFRKAS